MPLEEFLRSRIYTPLGMTDSSNREDPAKLQRMATVYRGSRASDGRIVFKQEFTPDDPPDFPIVRASGGMISTALDYAKFLQMYLNGGRYGAERILSAESIRKATSPLVKQGDGPWAASYGLGWAVAGDGVYSHGGSDGTNAWVDPARDLLVLAFTQSPGGKTPTAEFLELVRTACLEH
jgi:CubicO group peptidase (beta-lactamase class C family)